MYARVDTVIKKKYRLHLGARACNGLVWDLVRP